MKTIAVLALLGMGLASPAVAAVSPQEAAQLKTTLTPFGAEKAGNATGEIPAWTGGMAYEPSKAYTKYIPDPFASDKPVLKIDHTNVDQYASKLAPSVISMVKNFPTFYVNVYPTHRSAVAPQAMYDLIFANATNVTMDNHKPANNFGPIPFPIPKTGEEAIWNNNFLWQSYADDEIVSTYIVPFDRSPILSSTLDSQEQYFSNIGKKEDWNNYAFKSVLFYTAPPARAGERLIAWQEGNHKVERAIWQYLVGQHRLRKAPNIAYDGTFPDCAGFAGTDELEVFSGDTDRYDWKLLGKKEMYIPYDDNGYAGMSHTQVLGPRTINPETIRWELHRVWVVDATLAPGKRHTIPHRTFYLDEDTWAAMLSDEYNPQGQLYRADFALTYATPGVPNIAQTNNVIQDLNGGGYCAANLIFVPDGGMGRIVMNPKPASFFEPEYVASQASR